MFKPLTDCEPPPHPGEVLREDILPQAGLRPDELARHLGVPAAVVDELIAERRPVTVDLALRLGAALGQGARYWIGLQALHDVWQVENPAGLEPVRVRAIRWNRAEPRASAAGRR